MYSLIILLLIIVTVTSAIENKNNVKKHEKEECGRVCGDYIKWSYHSDCDYAGPRQWASIKTGSQTRYPYCNPSENGNQSPINIDCTTTLIDVKGTIGWSNITRKFKMFNNGHTIQANYEDNNFLTTTTNLPMVLEDAASSPTSLPTSMHNSTVTYNVAQFHLHWEKKNDDNNKDMLGKGGSEHSINGKFSPVEMHIVHYNSKFKSLEEAINSDGTGNLLVIGILFNINDDVKSFNPTLETFLQSFKEVPKDKSQNNDGKVVALDITNFLPPKKTATTITTQTVTKDDDLNHYFTYKGSLTTPPCNYKPTMPIVTWLISKTNMSISSAQLDFLKNNIYTDDVKRKTLISKCGNTRPIQCLGKRNTYDIDSKNTGIPKKCVRPQNNKCTVNENSEKMLCEDTIFWYTTAGVVILLLIIFLSAALSISLAYLYLYKNKSCPSCLKHMKNKVFGRNERLVSNVDSDLILNSTLNRIAERAGVDSNSGTYEYQKL